MAHPHDLSPSAPSLMPGIFITLEGVDGAGKSTQCALLCAALEQTGYEVVRLREPGGTAVGERIRTLLLDPSVSLDPLCELLLYEAARAQLVNEVIKPALMRGAAVVSDRFFDSTIAYQGHARGLGAELVASVNAIACGNVNPDRTIVLDLDPVEALRRASHDHDADRIEREGLAFQQRVHEGFTWAAAHDPNRLRVISALGDIEEVWGRMRDALLDIVILPVEPPYLDGAAHDER